MQHIDQELFLMQTGSSDSEPALLGATLERS